MEARLIGITVPANGKLGWGYADALRRLGADALFIRAATHGDEQLDQLYRRLDGLVFPGGLDVDPSEYRQSEMPECQVEVDTDLDALEMRLIRTAIDDGKPILAICRGMQLLNVAQGGSLWQDVQVQRATEFNHADKTARHLITPDKSVPSVLRTVTRSSSRMVNTSHHQAVMTLGEGLVTTAASPDGIIEGIELRHHRYGVAVQFHPERMLPYPSWVMDLFESFTDATHFSRSLW